MKGLELFWHRFGTHILNVQCTVSNFHIGRYTKRDTIQGTPSINTNIHLYNKGTYSMWYMQCLERRVGAFLKCFIFLSIDINSRHLPFENKSQKYSLEQGVLINQCRYNRWELRIYCARVRGIR